MHRITTWFSDEGDPLQVAVACLDGAWEPYAECVELVGPFHPIEAATEAALQKAHAGGGWRAHQLELLG